MILAASFVAVLLGQVLLVRELEHDWKEAQQWQDDVVVKRLGENFDLRQVRLEQVWLIIFALEFLGEFGKVVDLNDVC